MEFTHLLDKLKHSQTEEPEQFLAIQIDTEFVKTAVWAVENNTTDIACTGSLTEWDGTSTEILLEAIDNSLAAAFEKLGKKKEPNKVIFGLPETWVTSDGIAHPRQGDLKKICEKLALQPLGFVMTTEAITHYVKSKEGTPLTAILLRVSTSEVAVSIVNLGAIEATHVAGRSGDLASDVREGLTRFGERESMPSRMLMYNGGEDLQDLTQQLMAFDWQSAFPFLHLPKIEAENDMFSVTAIAVSGGAEVAKSLGFTIEEKIVVEEILPEQEKAQEKSQEPDSSVVETAIIQPDPVPAIPPKTRPSLHFRLPHIKNLFASLYKTIRRTGATIKSRIPTQGPRISLSLSNASLPRQIGITILFVVGLLSIICLGVIQMAKRLPKATARVAFATQTINQRLAMTVNPGAQVVDPQNHVLPAQKIRVQKSGEETRDATGKKTIGDKATGEVKVINKTNASKTFPAGTTITAPDGKQFVLDADASVASQSAEETDGGMTITFGTTTAKISATKFGPEYNQESGKEFKVSNLSPSAFSAKNDSAFSGGTKQDINVVSKKDRSDVKEALSEKLKSEATEEITQNQNDLRIFPETITLEAIEEQYSADSGEEAEQVKLSLTVEATALAIKESDYQNFLAVLLADDIPSGYALSSDDMQTTIENVKPADDGSVSFDAVMSAKLVPKVSQSDIASRIAGKRPARAAEALSSLPYFKSIELSFSPVLPQPIQWIPQTASHITIITELEE